LYNQQLTKKLFFLKELTKKLLLSMRMIPLSLT